MFELLAGPFASQVLSIAAQGIGITDRIRAILRRNSVKKKLTEYTERTLREVAQGYPDLPNSFFDKSFFVKEAASVVARLFARVNRPTSDELVALWLKQFAFPEEIGPQNKTKVERAAGDFLGVLQSYMRNDPEFREIFDSLSFDRIESGVEQIRDKLYTPQQAPILRVFLYRQQASFSLHQIEHADPSKPAVKFSIVTIHNNTNSEIIPEVQVPFNIENWRKNRRMTLMWHLALDNIGNEMATDVVINCRLERGSFMETRNEETGEIKSFENGTVSLGSLCSFRFEKVRPGEMVVARIITEGNAIPEIQGWAKGAGKFGVGWVFDLQMETVQ